MILFLFLFPGLFGLNGRRPRLIWARGSCRAFYFFSSSFEMLDGGPSGLRVRVCFVKVGVFPPPPALSFFDEPSWSKPGFRWDLRFVTEFCRPGGSFFQCVPSHQPFPSVLISQLLCFGTVGLWRLSGFHSLCPGSCLLPPSRPGPQVK